MNNPVSFIGAGGRSDPRQVSANDPLPVTVVAGGGTTPETLSANSKAVLVPGTAVPLAAVQTLVAAVSIKAAKAGRVQNVGSVFIGSATVQNYELVPTEWITFTAPPNKQIDLAAIFVDATNVNDGVTWIAHV